MIVKRLQGVKEVAIYWLEQNELQPTQDQLTVEEPLEIKLNYGLKENRQTKSLTITMRTPGHDQELALGFLYAEGIIGHAAEVLSMRFEAGQLEEAAQQNVLRVDLAPEVSLDWSQLSRHFYSSSSCGVCGKGSIEMISAISCYTTLPNYPKVAASTLLQLPQILLEAQQTFSQTGGLHAAALFDAKGQLLCLREDVGRHNAMDKLLGTALRKYDWPMQDKILLLSGRISFELVQKAAMAAIPIIAAVGAPSSLAVELAEEYQISLIGFLKSNKFNLYAGVERIQ